MPFPVPIKGVVIHANKVLLPKNPRDEWELPGGRLEIGETPEECVARDIEPPDRTDRDRGVERARDSEPVQ